MLHCNLAQSRRKCEGLSAFIPVHRGFEGGCSLGVVGSSLKSSATLCGPCGEMGLQEKGTPYRNGCEPVESVSGHFLCGLGVLCGRASWIPAHSTSLRAGPARECHRKGACRAALARTWDESCLSQRRKDRQDSNTLSSWPPFAALVAWRGGTLRLRNPAWAFLSDAGGDGMGAELLGDCVRENAPGRVATGLQSAIFVLTRRRQVV
jgi:hypothetical protein